MNTLRILATAGLVGLLATSVQAHNGVDHDGAYVEIDDLTITAAAGTLDVSGTVVYGGGEFLAFDDPAGDSLAPGMGLDLTTGTITQSGATVIFTAGLADLPAGDVQPGALYNWNIGVTGAAGQRLFAWRNNVLNGSTGEWFFSVVTFGEEGFSEAGVPGEFTGDSLIWEVSAAQIGGRAGARIGPGDGDITASQGGGGALQLTGFVAYDTASWSGDGSFAIGGGVELLLEGPGGEFELAPRTRKDAFDASFTDVPAGTYELTITSRYANVEFLKTSTVTIT
ncbi:MAG: hypothetical protein ACI867_002335 [Glaciecola sp.]|jgi:hypothetical protein